MKRVRDFHSQSWANPFFGHSGPGWVVRFGRTFVGLMVSGGLLYTVVYSPLFRISHFTVAGASGTDVARLQAAAAQPLGGYDYMVIPRDLSFVVSPDGVANYILANFPQLLTAEVKKNRTNLSIAVVERQPSLRLIIGDKSFLLDQDGFGMREATAGEGDALIAIEQNNAVFSAGKKMLSAEWLKPILELHKYFATQVGIRDQLFKIETLNGNIKTLTVEGWSAVFDPAKDITDQLKTLSSTLRGKFGPDERRKLDYVDVRFGDKVYYKWK